MAFWRVHYMAAVTAERGVCPPFFFAQNQTCVLCAVWLKILSRSESTDILELTTPPPLWYNKGTTNTCSQNFGFFLKQIHVCSIVEGKIDQ